MTRRLLAGSLGIIVVVLAVVAIPLGISRADDVRAELLTAIERDAKTIGDFVEDELEAGTNTGLLQAVADNYEAKTAGRVVITDAAGAGLADSDDRRDPERDFATRPEIATAIAGGIATGTRRSATLATGLVYVAVPIASGGEVLGAVRITYSTEELDERVRDVWIQLGVVCVIAIVVASAFSVAMSRWVTAPVRALEGAAQALGDGDLAARADTGRGPPEVRRLAAAFNAMAARLDDLVQVQQQFVADASHQLRTPLAALRLRLENLAADADSGAPATPNADDIEATLVEVARLSRLVDGLLALTRADQVAEPAGLTDVGVVVADQVDVWRPVAEEQSVDLVVDVEGPSLAVVGQDRLRQVVDNVVANALDAQPDGGSISVRIAADDTVVVTIADCGPGMTETQRERAFDRFWRGGGDARIGGSGLGLAIVDRLVRADNGSVRLVPNAPTGLVVEIRYPR